METSREELREDSGNFGARPEGLDADCAAAPYFAVLGSPSCTSTIRTPNSTMPWGGE
jgi:hypothetical protein